MHVSRKPSKYKIQAKRYKIIITILAIINFLLGIGYLNYSDKVSSDNHQIKHQLTTKKMYKMSDLLQSDYSGIGTDESSGIEYYVKSKDNDVSIQPRIGKDGYYVINPLWIKKYHEHPKIKANQYEAK